MCSLCDGLVTFEPDVGADFWVSVMHRLVGADKRHVLSVHRWQPPASSARRYQPINRLLLTVSSFLLLLVESRKLGRKENVNEMR